jgi:geranylgeranylglycerol-phosphate geranylgeranyltransferase
MPKGSSTSDYAKVTVPYYIPIAIIGIFVGIATSGGTLNYNVLLSFFSIATLIAAFNTFNGVTDFKIDLINKPHRPIPSGKMTRKIASFYSLILYLISLIIAYQLTTQYFLLTVLTSIITILYSLPLVRLRKRFIISNLCGGIIYGLLCPLLGWSLSPNNPLPTYILGFTFLFALSLSMSKDFEDYIGDKAYRIKTIPVVLGIEKAKLLSTIMLSSSFAYLIIASASSLIKNQYLLVAITLPGFIALIRRMYQDHKRFYNSMEERRIAKKVFLMLMSLAILVEFLVGIIAMF